MIISSVSKWWSSIIWERARTMQRCLKKFTQGPETSSYASIWELQTLESSTIKPRPVLLYNFYLPLELSSEAKESTSRLSNAMDCYKNSCSLWPSYQLPLLQAKHIIPLNSPPIAWLLVLSLFWSLCTQWIIAFCTLFSCTCSLCLKEQFLFIVGNTENIKKLKFFTLTLSGDIGC